MQTWQCECNAPRSQAHSTASRNHNAVHALKACKLGNANASHRARKHTAQLLGAIVLCMHSGYAKLGNAKALYRACKHTARRLGAIVRCMHPCTKHAKLGNANALHHARRHTAWLHGATVLSCTENMHTAMRIHCTVPAGTHHGI